MAWECNRSAESPMTGNLSAEWEERVFTNQFLFCTPLNGLTKFFQCPKLPHSGYRADPSCKIDSAKPFSFYRCS